MRRFDILAAQAEKLQREAAVTAQALAEGLMRPTGARDGIISEAAALADHWQAAQALALRMRRLVGPTAVAHGGGDAVALAAFARCLHLWTTALDAVEVCLSGREWPLFAPPPPRHHLESAQARVVSDSLTFATYALTPIAQDADGRALGYYEDIPLNAAQFVELAHIAYRLLLAQKRPRPLRFVDVGCGGALKVALAGSLFDEICGIDYDPGYVDAAKRTLMAMRAARWHVELADGLTWDGYGGFDVIYFYMPIRPDRGLLDLEARIVAMAPPHSVLVAPYNEFRPRAPDLGCAQIVPFVYIKGMDQAEADELQAEARRMGPDIPGYGAVPRDIGWLSSLWKACIANGICP